MTYTILPVKLSPTYYPAATLVFISFGYFLQIFPYRDSGDLRKLGPPGISFHGFSLQIVIYDNFIHNKAF